MAGETHVDHAVLAKHADEKVNIGRDEAKKRRAQVQHLRERLETHIAAHPGYDLVKMRASGSAAKRTAIRRKGSDADVAAYVRAASVGGLSVPERDLLEWLKQRCIEVYGKTKDADDFQISDRAVGITMRGSGLKIDIAPVLYEGGDDDRGYLVTRSGERVLTSVTLHLQFIRQRAQLAGPGYRQLIRLLKAWIRRAKDGDEDLRCKSFLLELIVSHLWDRGWHGEPLAVTDYPRAFGQVLGYIAHTGLKEPITFTDYYPAADVGTANAPVQVWDPVNPQNNVTGHYNETDRRRLVDCAASALEAVCWAATAPNKGDANEAWRELFGPTFQGA